MLNKKILVTSILSTFLISACSSTHTPEFDKKHSKNEQDVQETYAKYIKQMTKTQDEIGEVITDKPYVNKDNLYLESKKAINLPLSFRNDITFVLEEKVDATDFSAELFKNTGIVVEFVADKGENVTASINSGQEGVEQDSTGSFILPTNESNNNDDEGGSSSMFIKPFSYQGTFVEFLDYVSILNDMKWKYDENSGKVFFFETAMETFYVYEKNVEVTAENTITTNAGGQGSAGESSAGNQQEITFEKEENAWEDIENTVNNMLSSKGKVTFNRRQGKIVVEDNDYVLSKIDGFINEINSEATRQVTGQINVLNVKLDNANSMGLNFNYLNEALESNLLGDFAGSLTLGAQFSGDVYGNNTLGFTQADGGMEGLIGFLNTIGSVSINSYADFSTLNNSAVSFQVTANETYIEKIERETSSEGGRSNFSVETSEIKDGITMTVTPRIVGEEVMLDFSMALNVNDGFAESPVQDVQLPKTSNKNFNQTVLSNNGQTRILMAYKKENTKTSAQAPGSDTLWFLGGNEKFDTQEEIILITSTIFFDLKQKY